MEMKNKKAYVAPSFDISVIDTEDIITISGIFEDVDMLGIMGFGKIQLEMDIQ